MNKNLKIIIPVLIALAIALGFVQIKYNPLSSRTTVTHFTNAEDSSLADYYQKSLDLAAPQTQAPTVSFLAVGDIMLSRNVAGEIQKQNDANYPFLQMGNILKSTNFNFANLESPFYFAKDFENKTAGIVGGHSLVFGTPIVNISGLVNYNFQILNLANNHALDQGLNGLIGTKELLTENSILSVGAGENLDEAWQPAIVQSNGLKICFVGASYASINDGGKTQNNYVARMEDLDKLKTAIVAAKQLCDFTVATMHGGIEYTRTPNDLQKTFARAAIDDGADVVIGAHPHWVQTIEKYNGKWIFYSLGNFIFDQAFSKDTSEGLTLKMTISKKGNCHPEGVQPTEGSLNSNQSQNLRDSSDALGMTPKGTCADDLQGTPQPATLESIELLPIIITNSQPRPATEDETKKILQKIGETETILK